MEKVVVICGPTAVGKTKLSIAIAKYFKTDIINADAFLVYKKMNIGTAKPSPSEQDNIKHHLIDIIEPTMEFSIADYQKAVRGVIDELSHLHKLPLLVGGSGLYIDAVIKDYRFAEAKRTDSDFDNYSNEMLKSHLTKLDPELASSIHTNNRKRLIRAIELSNYPSLKDSRSHRDDFYYDTLCVFLNADRSILYKRINERVDEMLDRGLISEVEKIGVSNFSKTARSAIGYKEVIAYLEGKITYDELGELIKKNTRHFAKRQFTWFNNKTTCQKVDVDFDDFDKTIEEVKNLISAFLARS